MEMGLDDEDEPLDDEPPPIFYAYPLDYALHTWYDHRKNGTWPEGTCYNDQDPALMGMWQSLTARYNWHFRQAEQAKRATDELDKLTRGGREKRSLTDLFNG